VQAAQVIAVQKVQLALLALCAPLAACQHAPPPPPPSISLAGKMCDATPDIGARRTDLVMEKEAQVTFDNSSDCLDVGANKVAYKVFGLPASAEPFLVSVDSKPLGQGLFAPALQLLDANGKMVREISRDALSFHGTDIYAGFRAHPGEAYLVVASDPKSVGQQISKVMDMTSVTTAAAGPIMVTVHTGSEAVPTFTYALNGRVTVVARPIPKVK
jgi:hypothetical protein